MTAALVAAVSSVSAVGAVGAPEEGSSQPPDAIGVQLLDAPVERRQDPRASRSIIDHLRKGDVIERRVQVTSTYDRALDVPIYVEAASLVDGQFRPDGRGSPGNVLTGWVTVDPSPLPLAPGETSNVLVTVAVPRDAPDGEFYAVVFAEAPPEGDTVQTVNRAGVRLYISVGTGAEPPSDFEVDSLVAVRGPQGEPQVRVNVTNTGQRALDLRGELTLTDGPSGLSAGPFPARGVTTLGVAESGQLFVPLDDELPNGPWLATFEARSGELVRTVEGTISFPDASDAASDPAPVDEIDAVGGDADGDGVNDSIEGQRRLLLPSAALLILLALGALFLLLFWKRRDEEEEEEETPAVGTAQGGVDDGRGG